MALIHHGMHTNEFSSCAYTERGSFDLYGCCGTIIDNIYSVTVRSIYYLWYNSLAGHTYLPCAHTGGAQQKRGGGKIRMDRFLCVAGMCNGNPQNHTSGFTPCTK